MWEQTCLKAEPCMSPEKKSDLCYILKSPKLCPAIPHTLVIALSHCFVTQRSRFMCVS